MTSVRKPLFEMCYFHTGITQKGGGDVREAIIYVLADFVR